MPFEGKILTSDIIHEVVKNVIREKEYTPYIVSRTQSLKLVLQSEDFTYSDDQLEFIIEKSPQKHKEAGFSYGWDSRFDTWFKMIKEFGFIKYAMGKPITITPTGHMLVDAYLEEPCNDKKIQTVFLNALMKYQTNNPLRKNLNENVPLPLLLKVINLLHADPEENDAGLARHELPILICWRNNDAVAIYKYIKQIRKEVGFTCSDEYRYEKCLSILESDNRNYYKIEKICHESVDEYIRKMRMSGLLSLRGNGRFLDINSFEKESASYVISNYMSYPKFASEDEYIDYMGAIDTQILQIEVEQKVDFSDVRKNTLYKFAEEMSKESVKQNFEGLDVNPNYAVDDEGLPTFTASGGYSDIECYDKDYDSYFEVTLMCGRSDQVNNEIIPISRHLKEAKQNKRQESFAVFIAPIIHEDTFQAAEWQKMKFDVDIIPYDINTFLDAIDKCVISSELLTYHK